MHREVLLAWLAVLFGLMAAALTVAAALASWPVLLVALPMAGMAVLLWYHASGRLQERMRQHARRRHTQRRRRERAAAAGAGAGPRGDQPGGRRTGPFGARGTRFADGGRRVGDAAGRTRGAGRRSASGPGPRGGATVVEDGMSRERALSILDLEPGADDDAIRSAYRRKVKETHPDRGGDRDAFVEVTDAYEALGGSA